MSAGTDAETMAAALRSPLGTWAGGGLTVTRPQLMFAFVSAIASSISMLLRDGVALLLAGEGGGQAMRDGAGAPVPPCTHTSMFERGGMSAALWEMGRAVFECLFLQACFANR